MEEDIVTKTLDKKKSKNECATERESGRLPVCVARRGDWYSETLSVVD